jgi:hypothetical protein
MRPTLYLQIVAHLQTLIGTGTLNYNLAHQRNNNIHRSRLIACATRVTSLKENRLYLPEQLPALAARSIPFLKDSISFSRDCIPYSSQLRLLACTSWQTNRGSIQDQNRIDQITIFLRRKILNRVKLTLGSLGTHSALVLLPERYSCTRVLKTAPKVFKYCYLNASEQ